MPVSAAGSSGPCPHCSAIIRAPQAVPSLPGIRPLRLPPLPTPRTPGMMGAAVVLRPEPRGLENRENTPPLAARPIEEAEPATGRVRHSRPVSSSLRHLLRLGMPLVYFAITGVVILGVMKFVKRSAAPAKRPTGDAVAQMVMPILPENSASGSAALVPMEEATAPVLDPTRPAPPPPGILAMPVLEAFLEAPDLATRLPLIETKTPQAELESSILAGPLPAVIRYTAETQESHTVENVVDLFYNVHFDTGDGAIDSQMVLVRIRGNSKPKVVVDPLLDLYGGRLAAYLAEPRELGATFFAVVSAGSRVHDPNIPNPEKKFPLKLLAAPNGGEIATVYTGRLSAIGELLNDPESGLAFGLPRYVTLVLTWNRTEDPERPYLEALQITAQHWNP